MVVENTLAYYDTTYLDRRAMGLHSDRLYTLAANIRLEWMRMVVENTPAYYDIS